MQQLFKTMNSSILQSIAHAEKVLDALRKLASEPAAQPFRISGGYLSTSLIQFFPPEGVKEGDDTRDLAKPFARLLGGKWTADRDSWECSNVTYPGLAGAKIVLHYIVPKIRGEDVDLSEPAPERAVERDEPDYDAPKPLTPSENYFQNDEHHVR